MGIFARLAQRLAGGAGSAPAPSAGAAAASGIRAAGAAEGTFAGLTDPRLLEFMRSGGGASTEAGVTVSPAVALRNTTVLRCVSLISFAIAMLPLHLNRKADMSK